jgi:hypothetical protein
MTDEAMSPLRRRSYADRHPSQLKPVEEGEPDLVLDRMNRLSDFFKDFDRLVSPYMSHTQKALANEFLASRALAKVRSLLGPWAGAP